MKKKFAIVALMIVSSYLMTFAQEDTTKIINDTTKTTTTIVNKNDTTKIIIGNKQIQITESDKEKKSEMKSWMSGGFKGHLSGFEIGLNNYLNSDHKMSAPQDQFMSLNTNRSVNVNINFAQKSFGIIGNSFGMVTGMGLEFFNYFFENNNTIQVEPGTGNIINKPLTIDAEKSKLTFSYLTIPVIFEFQFPGGLNYKKRLHIAAGVIGGLKLGSHTKVVYLENGKKQKDKNHDDFNINSLKYGFTARVGYRQVSVFANYYPVSLFEKGKTPVLYPYSIGLAFTTL